MFWPFSQPPAAPPPPPTLLQHLEDATPTIVWLTGILGVALAIAVTQMPTKNSIALCQAAYSITFLVHFLLSGELGAVGSQLIGLANGALTYYSGNTVCQQLHKLLPLAIVPLAAATTTTFIDLLPLLAIGGRLVAFQSADVFKMRLIATLSLLPWLPYGVAISSWPVLFDNGMSVVLSIIALVRFHSAELRSFVGGKAKAS